MQDNNEELEQGRQMAAAHADRPYPSPMPDFKYMMAYHWLTGSNPEYSAHQIALAMDLGAPARAIRHDEDRWVTVDEIRNRIIREAVIGLAEEGYDE